MGSTRLRDLPPILTLVGLLSVIAVSAPAAADSDAGPGGFLGVEMTAHTIENRDPARAVIRVVAVVPGSAADKAGLQTGDLLLELDGVPLAKPRADVLKHFRQLIRTRGAGSQLSLSIRRRSNRVQTWIDGQPHGEGSPQPPDLGRLLALHPEQTINIQARAADEALQVDVTLTGPPATLNPPLPENAALRPDLDAQALTPDATLAGQAMQAARDGQHEVHERFRQLRERFEQAQGRDDPFRLQTVRYLHRAPLRLGNATRSLGRELRAIQADAVQGPDLDALLRLVRRHLDTPATQPQQPPGPGQRPGDGASAAAHGEYLLAQLRLAEWHVAQAFQALNAEQRQRLVTGLPTLAERFAETVTLRDDAEQAPGGQHADVIRILPKVDRSALLSALEALLPATRPDYLAQLARDLRRAEERGEHAAATEHTDGGILWRAGHDGVIGGSGNNTYRFDYPLVVDLGGDDRYRAPLGGGRPDRPAALLIDLAGDDRYQSAAPFAQGSGFMGVGLLYDHAGDDRYTGSGSFVQGSALAGAGLLIDRSGDDIYRATRFAQASALGHGLGALLDGGGDDRFSAGIHAQGFAGPGAFAALLSRGGDDGYTALGLIPSSYDDGDGIYRGMSQGAAAGFRHRASGGIAVLLDDGGEDSYEAGNFSQGGGYYFAWGLLIDLGDDADRYEGSRYAQGFATHSALGAFWDEGGNDTYRSWVGAANAAAWDLSAALFLDDQGDDRYRDNAAFSLGASAHNGFALFVDRDGRDRYGAVPGRAGPNDYQDGDSISVFIDAGGQKDHYRHGGLTDGRGMVSGETGLRIDLPVTIEAVDGALLERLLAPETAEP